MKYAQSTIRDAHNYFEGLHGNQTPVRTIDELRNKIHEAGLEWGIGENEWETFWDNIFESGWVYGEIKRLKCLRCNHSWLPRSEKQPKFCPKCNSPYWSKPRNL